MKYIDTDTGYIYTESELKKFYAMNQNDEYISQFNTFESYISHCLSMELTLELYNE